MAIRLMTGRRNHSGSWHGSPRARLSIHSHPSLIQTDTSQSVSRPSVGAALPLLVSAITPTAGLIPLVSGTSLVSLAVLGGVAARAGGAGVTVGAIRVTFWGALAMALTAGGGWLFGTVA